MTPEDRSLLIYVATRMAKLDAMIQYATPAIFVNSTVAAAKKGEKVDAKLVAPQVFAQSYAAFASKNLEFLCEQFPQNAKEIRDVFLLNERDLRDASSDEKRKYEK